MNSIQIDKAKCNGCGICGAQCPENLLTIENKMAAPVPGADMLCLSCGHCVAFCPQEAVTVGGITPGECLPLAAHSGLVVDVMKNRRSIRAFQNKPVERKILEELMEMTRYTPTGCNTQMNLWQVFSREKVIEINRLTGQFLQAAHGNMDESVYKRTMGRTMELLDQGIEAVTREAPHLIMVSTPLPLPTDSIIALTQIEMAAQSLGLGTCWGGWIQMAGQNFPPLQKYLELPEGFKLQGVLMLGYPRYQPKRVPVRKPVTVQWK